MPITLWLRELMEEYLGPNSIILTNFKDKRKKYLDPPIIKMIYAPGRNQGKWTRRNDSLIVIK